MAVYLGMGANRGDRRANLGRAITLLGERGFRVTRVSPVVESPALLPGGAPSEWNHPFLNLVVEGETGKTPEQLLDAAKSIEQDLGRDTTERWSPRPIDIDILLWGNETHHSEGLTIPHPGIHERAFVLVPLAHLEPRLTIPGLGSDTVLERAHAVSACIPLWMSIVNVTPDSFSDGGMHAEWHTVEPLIERLVATGCHIIDVGAESTRPGATATSPEEEWRRLEPVLAGLRERLTGIPLPPWVSVDTRYPDTAARALDFGVDMINDVTGLTDHRMQALAAAHDTTWVAMHSVSVPVERDQTLPKDEDPVDAVDDWLGRRIDDWTQAGLNLDRIIFDPGIGFGKDSLQSLELMRHVERFRRHNLRILVGHSRKSFMQPFVPSAPVERDIETIGASLKLCEKGVDILRVHDVPSHMRAYLAWSHL